MVGVLGLVVLGNLGSRYLALSCCIGSHVALGLILFVSFCSSLEVAFVDVALRKSFLCSSILVLL